MFALMLSPPRSSSISSSPRSCPKCRANLASVPVRDSRLRYPKCGTHFSYRRADDRLQTTPGASRRTANSESNTRRSRKVSKESPAREKAGSLPIVLILLGLGLFFLFLLVLGGGGVAYWYFSRTVTPTTAASAPAEVPQNAPLTPLRCVRGSDKQLLTFENKRLSNCRERESSLA
jgi:hypothetical protein